MERILVTGASGFIGINTAEFLSEKGYSITAQYRRKNPPKRLSDMESDKFKLVRTDFSDQQLTDRIVSEIDGIIHIAGFPSDWGKYKKFVESNVMVSCRLFDSAIKHKIKTFVFISSIAVHGFKHHTDSTEDGPYYKLVSHYQSTKKAAEDYVMQHKDSGVNVSVIRPANVYGPGDTTMMYKYFDQIMKGFLPLISRGKSLTSPVYITDLVNSIYLAYTKKNAAGQIYNISSGEKITWKEQMDIALKKLNPSARILSSPYWLARAAAVFTTFFAKLFGINSDKILTRYKVEQGGRNFSFSIKKAQQELGYKPEIMIDKGMLNTCNAYLESIAENPH